MGTDPIATSGTQFGVPALSLDDFNHLSSLNKDDKKPTPFVWREDTNTNGVVDPDELDFFHQEKDSYIYKGQFRPQFITAYYYLVEQHRLESLLPSSPSISARDLTRLSFSEIKTIAESGDAAAQYHLGTRYAHGWGVAKDLSKAVEWFEKWATTQGGDEAAFNLGMLYAEDVVPMDFAIVSGWYENSAAAPKDAEAQYNLGVKYEKGDGVPIDLSRALECYQKAAVQGYAEAQHRLGIISFKSGKDAGWGPQTGGGWSVFAWGWAAEWWLHAAAQGHIAAQQNLEGLGLLGRDFPKDPAQATERFKKEEVWRKARAFYYVGIFYRVGEGVPKNYTKAIEFFQKAAAYGYFQAWTELGDMYAHGNGTRVDLVLAYACYNLFIMHHYCPVKLRTTAIALI